MIAGRALSKRLNRGALRYVRDACSENASDGKALFFEVGPFCQCSRDALAIVRCTEAEEQKRAIHRQREQLVRARKGLEAQGRSLLVNNGMEPASNWWKGRTIAQLQVTRVDERVK